MLCVDAVMCFSPLFTVKLLYLTWFGASSCLLPYLSLHMRTLGVPPLESTIISGVLPLLQLVTCPLACLIPTQSSSFKKTVLWCLLFAAIASLFLVFTPVVPTASEKTISMQFRCGPDTQPVVVVDRCNYGCKGSAKLPLGIEAFFTECHVDCPNRKGRFKNTADLCFDDDNGRVCHVVEVNNTLSENFIFGIYLRTGMQVEHRKCHHPLEGVLWHDHYFHHVSCPIILKESNSKCILSCDLQEVPKHERLLVSGTQSCLEDSPDNVNLAIWVYFGLRAVFHMCFQVASILCEKALITFIKAERKNTRNYRMWSLIGTGIVTPLAGYLLDTKGQPTERISNYKLLFLLFFGLVMLTIVLFSSIQIEGTAMPSPKQTLRQVTRMTKELEVSVLFVVVLLLGIISGFLDTFLFWFLEDLSCPYYVMGVTITVGIPVGMFLLTARCSRLIRKLSVGNLMVASLLLQSLRCLGYFFADSYWWCLLLEFCGALAFHLMWASVSIYSSYSNPEGKDHGFRSFMCAIHYGLARGCGAAVGGFGMIYMGFPLTFLAFGSSSGVLGVGYFLLYHLLLKKRPGNPATARESEIKNVDPEEDNVTSPLNSPVIPSCADIDADATGDAESDKMTGENTHTNDVEVA